ncbi:MAG TPA: radical SAM/SPASM domain-containing protein [Tepidisphaeraceae bacterium]|jgi:radical SAM protein with 4Fe4S-binding SPASM domain|nr:radical SAM/SPASM domain-containing protein [Tepidisphaeraceae bacterium]
MTTLGLLSLLHEGVKDNSASRVFRDQPVLWWTLARLSAVQNVRGWSIFCWADQVKAVADCVGEAPITIINKGERRLTPVMEAITAAGRWLDGWRGGLLQTCDFDAGMHPAWMNELLAAEAADAVLCVDPAAGLVDSALVSATVDHAVEHPNEGLVFSLAAPGLNGVVLRKELLAKLAPMQVPPGRLLAYLQDQPGKDAIARECCSPVPTPVARTTRRFKLDSFRQVQRMERTFESLNGQLARTGAEQLVHMANNDLEADEMPREITLELTTTRHTKPIWSPVRYGNFSRPMMDVSVAAKLFEQLSEYPDTRVTFAGVGDPLLHPELLEILRLAREAGLQSLHLETDLVKIEPDLLKGIIQTGVDVVSFHVPAMRKETYEKIMGVDAFLEVMENLKQLVSIRHELRRGVPIIVPTFVKCRDNLHEMEGWYDQWLKVISSAVIVAPTGCGNLVPAESVGISRMAPPQRRACSRLWSRLMVLSDGSVTRCEQDIHQPTAIGKVGERPIKELWADMNRLRTEHRNQQWSGPCANCQEWHRP